MYSIKSWDHYNHQNIYPDITWVLQRFVLATPVRSGLVCLSILFVALWPPLRANAQESVGYVLNIEGGWYLNGHSQSLAVGDSVPAGGVIRIQSSSRDDFIQIAFNGGGVLSKRCRNDSSCIKPLSLPGTPQRPPSMLQSVMTLLRNDRGRFVVLIRRSPCGQPSEAIVQVEKGQVNLAPVFKGMAKDKYYVRFQRVSPGSKPVSDLSGAPTTIDWDPADDSTMPPLKFQAGIYVMTLMGCTVAKPEASIATAWFLVRDNRQYEQTASLFREAASFTEIWGDDVDRATVRGFLRAYLEYLDLQAVKKEK